MQKSFVALVFVTLLAPRMVFADSPAPEWKRQLRLTDGRTLVTDGPLPDEFSLAELKSGERPGMYGSPTGVILNAMYVDYLRRVLPPSTLRFRMKGDLEPVAILSSGTAVGLVMPMKR